MRAASGRRRLDVDSAANGSGAHTAKPWVASRRHRSSNSGRTPMMSGCSDEPAPRHAVGAGVDRGDGLAVGAAQVDRVDLDLTGRAFYVEPTPHSPSPHVRK